MFWIYTEPSSSVSTTGCMLRHDAQMDCAWTVMTDIRAISENKTFFIIILKLYNVAKIITFFLSTLF